PLPSSIRVTGPAAELVKLANSGVEEGVMMAFVTNSPSTFNLGAEEIIYLKDIGVPDSVVTAMILRDQTLRSEPATALAAAAPPPEAMLPPPDEVAPQPDASAEGYPPEPPPAETEIADDSAFYDSLAPYGNWAYLDGYGLCWQPTAVVLNSGWQPYYNCGRWAWTDSGWYWHSDYSWGWAPFHYGRWFRHSRLGWCWMPDRVWGPSWVSWRYTDGYCGWAPLPPGSFFTAGIGITFHGRHVGHWEDCGLRADHYRFVAWGHFHDRNFHSERLSPEQHRRVFHESVVATRFSGDGHNVVNNGLPPEQVAAATHIAVRKTALREVGGVGRGLARSEQFDPANRTLTIYRPKLPATGATTRRWAGAGSVPSAASARSAQSAQSAEVLAERYPGNRVRPGNGSSRPWREEPNGATRPGNQPLILRGPQSSAAQENAPKSSLVIIGRREGSRSWSSSYYIPSSPRAESAERAPSTSSSGATPWLNADTARPGTENWAQRVAPSRDRPQAYSPWGQNTGTGYQRPAETPRPAPRYEAPARTAPVETPRYTPAPAQSAPRSYSPPPSAPPARSAPSSPSQPNRGRR
ncbi:MAG: DUF6600 domain-containing protein, partial [Limisphaerales bacterium]